MDLYNEIILLKVYQFLKSYSPQAKLEFFYINVYKSKSFQFIEEILLKNKQTIDKIKIIEIFL